MLSIGVHLHDVVEFVIDGEFISRLQGRAVADMEGQS